MSETLLLVDASSSIFRAFYAIPPLRTASGQATNAALGFTTMLQKVLREQRPTYVAVAWDASGPRRRTTLYPEYKATRDATPSDLRSQLGLIRRIVAAMRVRSFEYAGEEADDVIASLARFGVEHGLDVQIVSTDRDLMQLVSERCCLLDTMRERRFGVAEVTEKFGVAPHQMLDFRALTGDSSDNIPGVSGIGDKGAAKLLQDFGSLDALLARSAEIRTARQREAIERGAESARTSRELSRLRDDLPLEIELEALRSVEGDREELAKIFDELELKNLRAELGSVGTTVAATEPAVRTECIDDAAGVEALVTSLRGEPRIGMSLMLEGDDEALRPALLGIAFATSSDSARLIDLRGPRAERLVALTPLLERTDVIWHGWGLKAAQVALARRGITLGGVLADVGVTGYLLDPEQPNERPEVLVKSQLSRVIPSTQDVFGKGAKRLPLLGVTAQQLADVFGPRAALSLELDPVLRERYASPKLGVLLDEMERPLTAVLARMELAGVRIDERTLESLGVEITRSLGTLELEIARQAGEAFNIGSPKQLQRVLFEKLKLPPSKKTKTGFSTDESVLEELALQHELPRLVLEHRKLSKLKGTYVDALPRFVDPETGRIHGRLDQTVAATGRLSASSPNLQNIPIRTPVGQRIRAAFIAAEDRLLLSADYSQIELRILAHMSEDPALVEAFRNGVDIHRQTASHVFGVSLDEVTPVQRDQMKAVNFGILYGSSAFGLAKTLGIAQSAAAEQIRAYFARFPSVRAFLDRTIEEARQRGFTETLDGRRRFLPDLRSSNRVQRAAAERMATNSAIQGTAADLIKRAMVRLDADLRAPGAPNAQMILQVHDELLFEVSQADLGAFQEQVRGRMENVASLRVPLLVQLGTGPTWLSAH